jgi:hydroxyethylthiazole kinase-like uncharacterized protein yjeF
MKILSQGQIKEADAYTILHEPIASIDLMERAALAFTERLLLFSFMKKVKTVDVYCGPGNNGGDGLAVARLLSAKGFHIRVFVFPSVSYSEDFKQNFQRIKDLKSASITVFNPAQSAALHMAPVSGALIVDALFGIGLHKPLDGMAAEWVCHINRQPCLVVSVDLPSGLPADGPLEASAAVVHATYTLTFQQPKLSMLFAEHAEAVGQFEVLDIGLSQEYVQSASADFTYVTHLYAAELLRPRAKFSHKGSYGHALLVAGSRGKIGAALLATKACLRSGAGLVTILAPACGYTILQSGAPEAMVVADTENDYVANPVHLDGFNVVGAGPGLGLEKQTQNILKLLIQQSAGPMVLDADALNILAENKTWISFIPAGSILTPHPKEFERLSGKKGTAFDRMGWQREFSVKHRVYVVLKGAHTSISTPEGQVFFNSSGNPGMAKGGSGDVLTGLLTGLLAQGYAPCDAAVLGVYLHGLAGDIAAQHLSMEAMTAGDIVLAFGEAFLRLRNSEPIQGSNNFQ